MQYAIIHDVVIPGGERGIPLYITRGGGSAICKKACIILNLALRQNSVSQASHLSVDFPGIGGSGLSSALKYAGFVADFESAPLQG